MITITYQLNLQSDSIVITIKKDGTVWDAREYCRENRSLMCEFINTLKGVFLMLDTSYTEDIIFVES